MNIDNKLSHVFRQFNLTASPEVLPGGSRATFRVGNVVLKQVKETSLENNHSPQLSQWIAEFPNGIQAHGFRIPKPVPTVAGNWITPDGWTAWTSWKAGTRPRPMYRRASRPLLLFIVP